MRELQRLAKDASASVSSVEAPHSVRTPDGYYIDPNLVQAAISRASQLLEHAPDLEYPRMVRAEMYWRLGQIKAALRDLEHVLKGNGDWRTAAQALKSEIVRESTNRIGNRRLGE